MFKTALIVSGVLALIALAAPGLVILGFFLLIIPGLILSLAPTVFVYLLLIAIIRAVAPVPPGAIGWIASVALAAGIGWAATLPLREAQTLRWRAQLKPEVIPAAPLQLAGDISLDLPPPFRRKRDGSGCDYLCAALLDTAGVTSVTVSDGELRQRFRLVPRGTAPDTGLRPDSPEGISNVFDTIDHKQRAKRGMIRPWEQTKAMREAIAAAWTLRLNTRETLVAEPVGDEVKTDWAIKIIRDDKRGDPKVERVEVLDRDGKARLRRSLVTHRILADFFAFDFVGGIENAHWAIARKTLSTGSKYASFDAPYELVSHVVLARPAAPADAKATLRAAVVAALDDPNAGPERLLAARDWLKSLGFKLQPEDEQLVVRIVEDRRVPDIARLLYAFLNEEAPVAFRRGFVARIVNPATSADDRGYYARWLARMPVGTFANPTADEQKIWADRTMYTDAAPFLARLADTGQPGLERMIVLIQEAAAIDSWPKRRPLVREIRRGFARMGAPAAPALPVVLPLYKLRSSPLMNEWRERQLWQMTLVRMGLPIDQMPYPSNFTPEDIAKEQKETLEAVGKYDPDQRDGYNY
ncbi:hypothetical protein [Sphingomonas sp. URHD0057]|uniref:hypothetical protein n=1 Tax=Sphingomonas sp. URHD0057 TaxID=1380389 RepID=UPI00048F6A93|nr:hypothetical protein [Sphingomonas sp. URHD0057]